MDRIFDKKIENIELKELFESDEKCLQLISSIKWSDGFVCRKCGNTNYCKGKSAYSRRCTKCKSEESATSETMFHHCKFPISKAFYIAYHVCKEKESISSYEFARRLSLRQMTCWSFKNKIAASINEINSISEKEKNKILKIIQE